MRERELVISFVVLVITVRDPQRVSWGRSQFTVKVGGC